MTQSLNAWNSYINCQSRCGQSASKHKSQIQNPFVTISRQTGAGGITISEKLIEFLRQNDKLATCPWTLFDKNLVHAVIETQHLPTVLEDWMPEEKLSELQGFFEDLFDLKPSELTLVHKTSETILHLAQLGCAVLVGRGSNVITRKMPCGFHVRLVGSFEVRVRHIQEYYGLTYSEAGQFIQREDHGKREYLKKHFNKDINDPLLYHLVINTDLTPFDDVVKMIGDRVLAIRQRIREGALL